MIEDKDAAAAYTAFINGEDTKAHLHKIYTSLLVDVIRSKTSPQFTKVMIREFVLRYAEYKFHPNPSHTDLWETIAKHRNTPADILFQMFEPYTTNKQRFLTTTGEGLILGIFRNPNIPTPIKLWVNNGGFADMSFKDYLNGMGCKNSLGTPEFSKLKEILEKAIYISLNTIMCICPDMHITSINDAFESVKNV